MPFNIKDTVLATLLLFYVSLHRRDDLNEQPDEFTGANSRVPSPESDGNVSPVSSEQGRRNVLKRPADDDPDDSAVVQNKKFKLAEAITAQLCNEERENILDEDLEDLLATVRNQCMTTDDEQSIDLSSDLTNLSLTHNAPEISPNDPTGDVHIPTREVDPEHFELLQSINAQLVHVGDEIFVDADPAELRTLIVRYRAIGENLDHPEYKLNYENLVTDIVKYLHLFYNHTMLDD